MRAPNMMRLLLFGGVVVGGISVGAGPQDGALAPGSNTLPRTEAKAEPSDKKHTKKSDHAKKETKADPEDSAQEADDLVPIRKQQQQLQQQQQAAAPKHTKKSDQEKIDPDGIIVIEPAQGADDLIPVRQQQQQQAGASKQQQAVASEPEAVSCRSISPSATDYWCEGTCKTLCPPTICKCGPETKQQQQAISEQLGEAKVSTEAKVSAAPAAVAALVNSSCVSIDRGSGIDDYWCATTCAMPSCPMDKCRCGDTAAADKAAEGKALTEKSCDFDTPACVKDDCRTCSLHIEACKVTAHFDKDNQLTDNQLTLDFCLDKIAKDVKDCSTCASDDSKEAYKVRMGLGMWKGWKTYNFIESKAKPKESKDGKKHTKKSDHAKEETEADPEDSAQEADDLIPIRQQQQQLQQQQQAAAPKQQQADSSGHGEEAVSCRSLSPSANDFWCQTTCKTFCPPTVCKCGPETKQQQQAKASTPAVGAATPAVSDDTAAVGAAWSGDNRNWGGNTSCVSMTAGIDDYWCATTCAMPGCPLDKCRCGDGDTAAVEKADEAKTVTEAVRVKGCDFDKKACMKVSTTVDRGVDTVDTAVDDCNTCSHHIEACKVNPSSFDKKLTSASRANQPNLESTLEFCMEKVANEAENCSKCASDDSKEAYKVRIGFGKWKGWKSYKLIK